ncbi:MAG TPA: hypothetical protein VK667_08965, partial [Ktedonobacteraceae bacterium]|nr:hypothetical protein [Ktedonobacteraceae bacterium]
QMRPAQARGSTQTLLKQHDQHTDALGRRRLPTTGKNPHPLQKFSLFAEQTLLFLSWCVWAIPCGRPGSLSSRLWGQAPALTFFVGGYATRSSRGDGVAYPPANI